MTTATATIAETALPTAEHIAALFREHDVLPEQLVYLDTVSRRCRACAIGILLVEIRGSAAEARAECRRFNRTVAQALEKESGLPPMFLDGLDDGFSNSDGGEIDDEEFDDGESLYGTGYRVGWNAWGLANTEARTPMETRP